MKELLGASEEQGGWSTWRTCLNLVQRHILPMPCFFREVGPEQEGRGVNISVPLWFQRCQNHPALTYWKRMNQEGANGWSTVSTNPTWSKWSKGCQNEEGG